MDDYPWPTYGSADCRLCGESFERKCTGQVYCSPGCRWNWWYAEKKRRAPRLRLGIRECRGCGEWFTPKRRSQRCCDTACGHAYANASRHLRIRECQRCGRLTLGSFPKPFCSQRCKRYSRLKDSGLVYFIQAGDDGPVKVGRSADPRDRLMQLQTSHFAVLHLRAVVAGGPRLEGELHRRLRDHRLLGEWFSPAPEVLAAMAEYASEQIRLVA